MFPQIYATFSEYIDLSSKVTFYDFAFTLMEAGQVVVRQLSCSHLVIIRHQWFLTIWELLGIGISIPIWQSSNKVIILYAQSKKNTWKRCAKIVRFADWLMLYGKNLKCMYSWGNLGHIGIFNLSVVSDFGIQDFSSHGITSI